MRDRELTWHLSGRYIHVVVLGACMRLCMCVYLHVSSTGFNRDTMTYTQDAILTHYVE